jgi:hypothetical protein
MIFKTEIRKEEWPRLNFPEFTTKLNVRETKRKSIFVQDTGNMNIEEAIAIAKDQAQKMGMGNKELLVVLDCPYSTKEKGWCVIVQSRI